MQLHVITNDEIVARPNFISTAESIIDTMGPLGAFHLRTRLLSGKDYLKLALQLVRRAQYSEGLLVINDRVDVALASGAHGVQLGSGSLSVRDARAVAPTIRIGASIHSIEALEALGIQDATEGGADWLTFGHLFETNTHLDVPARGLSQLKAICAKASRPVIAIGGITPRNARSVLEAGASGVAVISGIWDAKEPTAEVINYLSLYGNGS